MIDAVEKCRHSWEVERVAAYSQHFEKQIEKSLKSVFESEKEIRFYYDDTDKIYNNKTGIS